VDRAETALPTQTAQQRREQQLDQDARSGSNDG
jgi:hypothetical protein